MTLPNGVTVRLTQIIIGIVSVVWCLSFFADVLIPTYKADQINSIFMAVIGGGGLLAKMMYNKNGAGPTGEAS